jgi:hydrogenase nickel incorporation protein HypA/HybF
VHEVSIVESLISQVEQEVTASGHAGRVTRLDLVIGRHSGVYSEAIRFAFQLLSPGTLVEAAELRIAEPKARCRCDVCGACVEVEELVAQCPECGDSEVAIEGGQELLLESIELEE